MATQKAASTKKATAKKPAPKATSVQTTVKTLRADDMPRTSKSANASGVRRAAKTLPNNIVNIVLVELLGTMILTLVALTVFKETGALYVGLAFAALSVAGAAVSGAHFNPALSFGLWTMRRLRSILLPFYWGAQFLGAMLAVILMNVVTNNAIKLNFEHFWFNSFNWAIFGVELVGAAVFMFGLAAVLTRNNLSEGSSVIGRGVALIVGLVVASSLLGAVQGAVDTSAITAVEKVPHELRVKSATLNPAVALASTEQTDSSFTGSRGTDEKQFSRLSMEVILATLIGAALGGNLYLLVAGRRNA